jgi:hypothetical protein
MPENSYQIVEVTEVTMMDAARNPVRGYRVYFTWGQGRQAHIEIERAKATKEMRDQLIEAEIARHEGLWS